MKHKWTITIIAQYDDSDDLIKAAYDELEQSICNQKENKSIDYIIFKLEQDLNKAAIRQPDYTGAKPVIREIESIAVGDFYSGKELNDFFERFVKKQAAPVKKSDESEQGYTIITWGHGAGFGLFPHQEKQTESDELAVSSKTAEFLQVKKLNSFLKAQVPLPEHDSGLSEFQFDDDSFSELMTLSDSVIKDNVLNLQVFKEAIQKNIGVADVLITMNCYMQMFETGYFLRDAVDIMISPQSTISFWGFNYNKLFELFATGAAVTAENISENVCLYYAQKYFEEPFRAIIRNRPEPVIMPNKVAFSANRLSLYERMRVVLSRIIKSLNDNKATKFHLNVNGSEAFLTCIMRNARSRCVELTKGVFVSGVIDIKTFFDNTGLEIEASEFEDHFEDDFREFESLKRQCIVAMHQPGRFFEPEIIVNALPIRGAQGLSMFFPFAIKEEIVLLRQLRSELDYGKLIGIPEWNEFLDNFISATVMC